MAHAQPLPASPFPLPLTVQNSEAVWSIAKCITYLQRVKGIPTCRLKRKGKGTGVHQSSALLMKRNNTLISSIPVGWSDESQLKKCHPS
ncbi:hypothetical protein YC2023_010390 [Brassica napus]